MSLSPSSFCEHCGTANKKQALVCQYCGHFLQKSADVLSYPEIEDLPTIEDLPPDDMHREHPRKRRSLSTTAWLVVAFCCLLIGGFSGDLIGTRNATDGNVANQATILNATGTALVATSTAQANATMATELNSTATAIVQTVTAMPDPNTIAGALPAPVQTAPRNGTVFNNYPRTLTLAWNSVAKAISYTVLIYYFQPGQTNCIGGTPLSKITDLTSTSYTFDYVGAQPGCWQVWATNAAGDGQKSPFWEFSFTQ